MKNKILYIIFLLSFFSCKLEKFHEELERSECTFTAAFEFENNNCHAPCIVQFNNITTNGLDFYWDFGDGHTSNEISPFHEFQKSGGYNVRLVATDQFDCVDSVSIPVNIKGLTFIRNYGSAFGLDEAFDINFTYEGDYVIAGTSYQNSGTGYDGYLLFVNQNGEAIDSLFLDNNGYTDKIYALDLYNGSQIWTNGETYTVANTDIQDQHVFKTSQAGTSVLHLNANLDEFEKGTGVKILQQGLITCGYTSSTNNDYALDTYKDASVTCFFPDDSTGHTDFIWQYTYGEDNKQEAAFAIEEMDNGNFLVSGVSGDGLERDAYVFILDQDGMLQDEEQYGGAGIQGVYCSVKMDDGSFMLGGVSDDDPYLIKLDDQGSFAWEEEISSNTFDRIYGIDKTSDGGIVLVGSRFEDGQTKALILKTDADGNEEWAETHGANQVYTARAVKETADGGFILTGFVNKNGRDVLLIKTNHLGKVEQ